MAIRRAINNKGNKSRMITQLTRELIEKFGIPDIIYYSPFYRIRETRKAMVKEISKYKKERRYGSEENEENKTNYRKRIKLKLEPRLGRFFSGRERKYPDISSKTKHKGAIIKESWSDFQERVKEHMIEICEMNEEANRMRSDEMREEKVIWNITHSLVILHVAKLQKIRRNSHVEYLDILEFSV